LLVELFESYDDARTCERRKSFYVFSIFQLLFLYGVSESVFCTAAPCYHSYKLDGDIDPLLTAVILY